MIFEFKTQFIIGSSPTAIKKVGKFYDLCFKYPHGWDTTRFYEHPSVEACLSAYSGGFNPTEEERHLCIAYFNSPLAKELSMYE